MLKKKLAKFMLGVLFTVSSLGSALATCCVVISSTPCPGGCGPGDPEPPYLYEQFYDIYMGCSGDCIGFY